MNTDKQTTCDFCNQECHVAPADLEGDRDEFLIICETCKDKD